MTEFITKARVASEMEQHYDFMMKAAHDLGRKAYTLARSGDVEMHRKPDNTKVTTADLLVNRGFIEMADRMDPNILVWGEEESNGPKGDLEEANKKWTFVLDPIDRTSSFWRACQTNNFSECPSTILVTGFAPGETTPTMSVVHNPFYRPNQTISANPTGVFYTNHAPGGVTRRVVVPDGPRNLDQVERFENNSWRGSTPDLERMASLMPQARRLKHALFMGGVALGDTDISAFPSPSNPHDVAPGALIVHRAGGAVTDIEGRSFEDIDWRVGPLNGCIAANNEELAQNLAKELQTRAS